MKKVKDITKSKRYFRIGELVFNCNYANGEEDNFDWGKITLINGKPEDGLVDDDTIVTLSMEHNGFEGDNECYGSNIYKLCKRWTKMLGERICFEHHNFADNGGCNYPYFIPANDANYFKFELDRMWLEKVTKKHTPNKVNETIENLKQKYINNSEVCMAEFLASERPCFLTYEEVVQVYASLMNWAENDIILRTNKEEGWTENITTGERFKNE